MKRELAPSCEGCVLINSCGDSLQTIETSEQNLAERGIAVEPATLTCKGIDNAFFGRIRCNAQFVPAEADTIGFKGSLSEKDLADERWMDKNGSILKSYLENHRVSQPLNGSSH